MNKALLNWTELKPHMAQDEAYTYTGKNTKQKQCTSYFSNTSATTGLNVWESTNVTYHNLILNILFTLISRNKTNDHVFAMNSIVTAASKRNSDYYIYKYQLPWFLMWVSNWARRSAD